jgi:drug/metabolite transporter (DMT)-like permease
MAFQHPDMVKGGGFNNPAVTANLICMLSMLTWAAGFPAAEILLATWDPLTLIVARLALVCVVLLPIWIVMEGLDSIFKAHWRRGLIIGGIGFGAGTYLILVGQAISDPVTVTIVAASMPVIGAMLEVLFDGRRLRVPFVLGIALAIVGGLVAAGANVSEGSAGLGALLALISVLFFAWGSRAAVKDLPEMRNLGRTTLTLTGAFIFVSLAFGAAWGVGFTPGISAPVDAVQLGHLTIFALGAMALSQWLWLMGVGRLGIALASIHMNAAPIYVMMIVVAMGGYWSMLQVSGAFLVGLGVLLAQRRKRQV